MNIVDSSGWLEYFADTERADLFSEAIEDIDNLLVPTINIYEVFKKVMKERGQTAAVTAMEQMQLGKVLELDEWTAVLGSKISLGESLGMADSIIYATALLYGATLWTQDADFKDLPNVNYFAKK
ncbi:MAG: type II toxin-antitoxin system VapC family toxin [Patescibacteria group bacterium]